MEVGIKKAKNDLSKLVAAARSGEEVYLVNRGERVAKIVTVNKPRVKNRGLGMFKDVIHLPDDWGSPEARVKQEEEFLALFEGFE
ncbi:MAG: type II toxin-antitoxin system prevent-host-death family antitoxin [Acidobacteriaceae bacterium]|nr:type II toxin-antitoxin system prevent-host-death family antitoxin [Acidobacteriaceae bacterium]